MARCAGPGGLADRQRGSRGWWAALPGERELSAGRGRLAVCVSGRGTNLAALLAAQRRGSLGGIVELVLADRECLALDLARAADVATVVVAPGSSPDREGWDRAVCAALSAAAPDVVVLAGFMRVLGPQVLERFSGRILNVHPSLLPAFPGADAIGDALVAGAVMTGVTVHLVDDVLDGGPIVLQEAVPIRADEDRAALTERIHAVEHRLLPRAVALALAGALSVEGPRVRVVATRAADMPRPRRALISLSDKTGLEELGRGLVELGFELVSTGGTARTLRAVGLEVTDVAAVTGFPEMLDGRVKTLHPRVAGGVLADWRSPDHRAQLAMSAIEPFELVVVNLYRFAEAAAKPGIELDELIEEIDIGGPTLVRAAAKNHASVGIVTDRQTYPQILAELRERGSLGDGTRRRLALDAFTLTAGYDGAIATELRIRLAGPEMPQAAQAPAAEGMPVTLDVHLRRAASLRYGENPHQAAALYTAAGEGRLTGPFAGGAKPLQGKELSYNNILDASAAAALARDLRGAAAVVVKHGNPCGAAEAGDLREAWRLALAGDPISAFGGVVAIRGTVDGPLARGLTSIFLEVIVAPRFDDEARAVLATKPNLRLLEDRSITQSPQVSLELRSAGGGVLVTEADALPDDPATWRTVTQRAPTDTERSDLDLAWRICRRVASNAIVLVRGGALVGVGAGQMSRVDSARLAVEKAGPDRASGAVCASDAFYPFPDGLEVCAAAGVTAFVQPGGSQRDAEVIAAADRVAAAMLVTGVRHFRH